MRKKGLTKSQSMDETRNKVIGKRKSEAESLPCKHSNKICEQAVVPISDTDSAKVGRIRSMPDLKPIELKKNKLDDRCVSPMKIKLNSADNTATVIKRLDDLPSGSGSGPIQVATEPAAKSTTSPQVNTTTYLNTDAATCSQAFLRHMRRVWDSNNNRPTFKHKNALSTSRRNDHNNLIALLSSAPPPPPPPPQELIKKISQGTQTRPTICISKEEYVKLQSLQLEHEQMPGYIQRFSHYKDFIYSNNHSRNEVSLAESVGNAAQGNNKIPECEQSTVEDDGKIGIDEASLKKVVALSDQNKNMLHQKLIENSKIIVQNFVKDLKNKDDIKNKPHHFNTAKATEKQIGDYQNVQQLVPFKKPVSSKDVVNNYTGCNHGSVRYETGGEASTQSMPQYRDISYQSQMLSERAHVPGAKYQQRPADALKHNLSYDISRRPTTPAQVPTARPRPPISLTPHAQYYNQNSYPLEYHRYGQRHYPYTIHLQPQYPQHVQQPAQYGNVPGNVASEWWDGNHHHNHYNMYGPRGWSQ